MNDTASKAGATTAPETSRNVASLAFTCFLAWLVPGLGHFALKRPRRAIAFTFCICFLFLWGLSLGGKIYQFDPQQPLTLFAMIAQAGMGAIYFVVRALTSYAQAHSGSVFYGFAQKFDFGSGAIDRLTFEYGNTFAIVAGLLNFLVILDAYDIATGKKKG
jgi:hypothetical protein